MLLIFYRLSNFKCNHNQEIAKKGDFYQYQQYVPNTPKKTTALSYPINPDSSNDTPPRNQNSIILKQPSTNTKNSKSIIITICTILCIVLISPLVMISLTNKNAPERSFYKNNQENLNYLNNFQLLNKCDDNNAAACYWLGMRYMSKNTSTSNINIAQNYLARSCVMLYKPACDQLSNIPTTKAVEVVNLDSLTQDKNTQHENLQQTLELQELLIENMAPIDTLGISKDQDVNH